MIPLVTIAVFLKRLCIWHLKIDDPGIQLVTIACCLHLVDAKWLFIWHLKINDVEKWMAKYLFRYLYTSILVFLNINLSVHKPYPHVSIHVSYNTYQRFLSPLVPSRAFGHGSTYKHWDVNTLQQKIREERIDHVVCKCSTGRRAPKAVYLYLLATCDRCMR